MALLGLDYILSEFTHPEFLTFRDVNDKNSNSGGTGGSGTANHCLIKLC